jgi:activating signal cointegrator complex subunit 2
LAIQVRDLLPDLGSGFVEACLAYFDHNPEKVINSLLEENLPPHLMDLDRTTQKKKETEVARHNVFDGDEFDVNSRDRVDKSRVHRGKYALTKTARDANALLDDKKDLECMRDRFNALSVVTDIVYLSKEDAAAADFDGDYDDEYDDTYDDNAVGQEEPDAMDSDERRPFVLPRALGGGHVAHVKEQEADVDEEEEDGGKKRDEFLRNPAQVREERERKWRESNRGRGGRPPANKDLVGRAKGQGQDKSVLVNRARKNTNKSKGHKAGADRKQAKGMF